MKKVVYCLFILLLSFVFAGCHGGGKSLIIDDLPVEFDESKNYTISFWAKNDGNIVQKEIYNDTIKRFEEYYPNIKVEIKNYTSYPDIYKDVLINIPTKTTPNVCISYPDHVATYKEGEGIIANLESLMDNPSYGFGGSDVKFDSINKSDIFPKFLNEGVIDNRYYTIPFMRSSEACYINKDYVLSLGYEIPDILTWDWMWEVCDTAYKKHLSDLASGEKTDPLLYPMIYKSTDNMFITMNYQKKVKLSNSDGEVLLFNDDIKNYLVDIAAKYDNHLFSTFKKTSYPGNFYNKWQCIFAIDSTAGATWIGVDATSGDSGNGSSSDKPRFETVVRAVPQYDVKNPMMISQGPSICIFDKEDKDEVIASWLFAQFLLTNETQIAYSKTEGYIPVTSKATNTIEYKNYLNDNSEYKVKRDAAKIVLDNVNNTFITPVFNGSSYVRDAGSYLIEAVCNNRGAFKKVEDMDKLFNSCITINNLGPLIDIEREELKVSPIIITVFILIGISWIAMGSYVVYEKFKRIE